jgi:hypothetical protein
MLDELSSYLGKPEWINFPTLISSIRHRTLKIEIQLLNGDMHLHCEYHDWESIVLRKHITTLRPCMSIYPDCVHNLEQYFLQSVMDV